MLVLTGLILVGCEGNNPYPMSSIYPESTYARDIQEIYKFIFYLSIPVMVMVTLAVGYILFKFRERPGAPLPPQIHGNTRLEILWTFIPAVVLIFVTVPTVNLIFKHYKGEGTGEAMPIEVIGHQFWWEFRYPNQGVVTANELVVPVGRPVVLNITSDDVLHSFWIPRLGGKKTVTPGFLTQIYFTADRPNYYWGQCGEYCGTSHANMRIRAITLAQADFDAWVAKQRTTVTAAAAADRGAQLFQQKTCNTCHVVSGLNISMFPRGPNLTHVGSRSAFGAGLWELERDGKVDPNAERNLIAWIKSPEDTKPGSKMPAVAMTDEERQVLARWLLSLK